MTTTPTRRGSRQTTEHLTSRRHWFRRAADDEEAPALDALVKFRSYRPIAAVLPYLDLAPEDERRVRDLCTFAASVVDMDAEDWSRLRGVPDELLRPVHAAHTPQQPDQPDRGALASLTPTYGLFLEALATRWHNEDLYGAMAVVHLMGEYLPLLAWQSVLGHAGDPRRLPDDVGGEDSRWGSDPHTPEGHLCDHSPSIRGSLRHALRVGFPERNGGGEQAEHVWLKYLDYDHSRVSGALLQCGTHPEGGRPTVGRECRHPCSVWLRHDERTREELADRLVLAAIYADGPLVRLRHAAPVGHGFGVPDTDEVAAAWAATWRTLTKPWSGRTNPMDGLAQPTDDEPLPGLATFLTHVAGTPIRALGVLREADAIIARILQVEEGVAPVPIPGPSTG